MTRAQPPQILLIDDEVAVCMILARSLRPWEVVTVHDGRSAIARLDERVWDAVLCDLSLPVFDGITLYARASAEQRRRFLFMTGGAYTEAAQRFLEQCGSPTIYKPFEAAAVRAEVARLLDMEG